MLTLPEYDRRRREIDTRLAEARAAYAAAALEATESAEPDARTVDSLGAAVTRLERDGTMLEAAWLAAQARDAAQAPQLERQRHASVYARADEDLGAAAQIAVELHASIQHAGELLKRLRAAEQAVRSIVGPCTDRRGHELLADSSLLRSDDVALACMNAGLIPHTGPSGTSDIGERVAKRIAALRALLRRLLRLDEEPRP